jgi:hypothetical protein
MKMSRRFDIEKYNKKISFALWQVHMAVILSTLGVKDAIFHREKIVNAMTDEK